MIRRLPSVLATLGLLAGTANSQLVDPPLPGVDWAQNLGAQVPLDASFTRHDGETVTFDDLLDDRPVILALVYFECPMLCNLVLEGLVSSLKGMNFLAGDEFDVVVLSIDPGETVELANLRRTGWLDRYARGDEDAWHFLIGDEANIASVADAVGFEFSYVPSSDEYAHAAGISVLTPEGVLSRIFYGTEYAPRDVKFGLMEAAGGTIGSPIEKFVLRCFQYDPTRGVYGFAIMTTLRVLGILTVIGILAFVVAGLRRDHRRAQLPLQPSPEDANAS